MQGLIVLIRNDDISVDTCLDNLVWFCELCDKYELQVVHCITPLGETHGIHYTMTDDEIVAIGKKKTFLDNWDIWNYLKNHRSDLFAVHGLWHSHSPSINDIYMAKTLLTDVGLTPKYYVPPFNEGVYPPEVCELKLLQLMPNIEHYLDSGKPDSEMFYTHSWRYGMWYPKEKLEQCLMRITTH
jgi:hypothetical protein